MVDKIDYMALLEARATGSKVRTVKRPICLTPELFDQRTLLQKAVAAERVEVSRTYAGSTGGAVTALKEVDDQIVANSISVTFNVPDPGTQARYSKSMTDSSDETFPPIARAALVECYRSAVDPEGNPLPITREQFAALTEVMWSGELLGVFGALMRASTDEPDFPSSVRR